MNESIHGERPASERQDRVTELIEQHETEVSAKVIWGAQCRKSARWVLLGETSSRSHARSVRALARKRQITARLRKGLPLQGSSLPSRELDFRQAQPSHAPIASRPRPAAPFAGQAE